LTFEIVVVPLTAIGPATAFSLLEPQPATVTTTTSDARIAFTRPSFSLLDALHGGR
jgi:hypothetical protein